MIMAQKVLKSEPILYTMAATMAAGIALSMALSTDTSWMHWHLSRLGEGNQFSAGLFNIVAALCALMMGAFTHYLVDDVGHLDLPAKALHRAQTILGVCLGVISVCMMGIAVFPFDRFPVVHNIFGYGATITFVQLIILLPNALPVLSHRFTLVTYNFVVFLAIAFGIYFATGGKVIALINIEILALMYFYLWMIALERAIKQKTKHLQ